MIIFFFHYAFIPLSFYGSLFHEASLGRVIGSEDTSELGRDLGSKPGGGPLSPCLSAFLWVREGTTTTTPSPTVSHCLSLLSTKRGGAHTERGRQWLTFPFPFVHHQPPDWKVERLLTVETRAPFPWVRLMVEPSSFAMVNNLSKEKRFLRDKFLTIGAVSRRLPPPWSREASKGQWKVTADSLSTPRQGVGVLGEDVGLSLANASLSLETTPNIFTPSTPW